MQDAGKRAAEIEKRAAGRVSVLEARIAEAGRQAEASAVRIKELEARLAGSAEEALGARAECRRRTMRSPPGSRNSNPP
ncbi:MAG: hypothetical protein U1G05_06410 [Kiritimatiellia bacterium]